MLFTGPTDPVVHLGDLIGLAISHLGKQMWPSIAMCLVFLCSARMYVGVVISNKLDFNSYVIRKGFCISSHILQVQLYYKHWTIPKRITVVFPCAIIISFISQLLLVTTVTSLVFL